MRELGETILGVIWEVLVWAWGAVLIGIVLLFPLGAAIAIDAIARDYPPALVLGSGVGLAYVLAIAPWNGDAPWHLPVAVAAAATCWAAWTLSGRTSDLAALGACIAVALAGWFVSRFIVRRNEVLSNG